MHTVMIKDGDLDYFRSIVSAGLRGEYGPITELRIDVHATGQCRADHCNRDETPFHSHLLLRFWTRSDHSVAEGSHSTEAARKAILDGSGVSGH